jgi:hypothetical protein
LCRSKIDVAFKITIGSKCNSDLSQSKNWPVGFDHNGELVVWKEEDEFWDELPLDWALAGDFGEEAMAIRDAMEE